MNAAGWTWAAAAAGALAAALATAAALRDGRADAGVGEAAGAAAGALPPLDLLLGDAAWVAVQRAAATLLLFGVGAVLGALGVYVPKENQRRAAASALDAKQADLQRVSRDLEFMMTMLPNGVARGDNEGRLVYANERFFELVELRPAHLQEWVDLIHPLDRDRTADAWLSFMEDPAATFEVEFRQIRPRCAKPAAGGPRLEGPPSSSSAAAAVAEPTEPSPAAPRLQRRHRRQSSGASSGASSLTLSDAGHSSVAGGELAEDDGFVPASPDASGWLAAPDGVQYRWFLVQGKHATEPRTDGSLRIVGNVYSVTDVTYRKALEEERLRLHSQAAALAEQHRHEQELFVDSICHGIRNPLNGVLNNLELLRYSIARRRRIVCDALRHAHHEHPHHFSPAAAGPDADAAAPAAAAGLLPPPPPPPLAALIDELAALDAADADSLAAIETCANHQRVITSDVLNYSRLKANKLALQPGPFRVGDLVETARLMFAAEARVADIDLLVDVPADARSAVVVNDRERLAQILTNLLSNAIKFTRGCETRRIVVAASVAPLPPPPPPPPPSPRKESAPADAADAAAAPPPPPPPRIELTLRVQDTGIGMALEDQQVLFNRFGQIAQAPSRTYTGGSGLGLSICKLLLDLMGGRIAVDARPNQGATFTVQVPCDVASPAMVAALARNESAGAAATAAAVQYAADQASTARGSPVPSIASFTTASSRVASRAPSAEPSMSLTASTAPATTPVTSTSTSGNDSSDHSGSDGSIAGGAATAADHEGAQPGRPLRVLVVEDNLINQSVVKRQLTTPAIELAGRAVDVTIANHGQEALQLLEAAGPFDVVLMDIQMPVMDGLAATRAIRRRGVAVPIIGLTGNARPEQADEARAAGMQAYLTKPYTRAQLLEAIRGSIAAA